LVFLPAELMSSTRSPTVTGSFLPAKQLSMATVSPADVLTFGTP
jgi:hypothetical protein